MYFLLLFCIYVRDDEVFNETYCSNHFMMYVKLNNNAVYSKVMVLSANYILNKMKKKMS